jgi:hypothetical protein
MTRKHFEAIAAAVRETELAHGDRIALAHKLGRTLAAYNPSFQFDRFIKACGVEG